jgi:nitroimidazol reductase NimA-like FMN-containing flavoprotein (pyridoxamine 5'-phosphate oxidase superfamily)
MRRRDREVTDFESIIRIMDECSCCRIGVVDNGEAYIVPMNFGYDGSGTNVVLYFHCANEGRKIDLIPRQEWVSFEMDTGHSLVGGDVGCDFTFLYQSIMGRGKMEIIENDTDKAEGLKIIMAHYTKNPYGEFRPDLLRRTSVLKLSVEEISCKEHK